MDGATRDRRWTTSVETSAREAPDPALLRARSAPYAPVRPRHGDPSALVVVPAPAARLGAGDPRSGHALVPVHDPTLPRHRKALS